MRLASLVSLLLASAGVLWGIVCYNTAIFGVQNNLISFGIILLYMLVLGAVNIARDEKIMWKEIVWELLSLLVLVGIMFTMSSYVSENEFEREGIAICVETETKIEHTQGGFWFSALLESGELKCTHKSFSFVITENERNIVATFTVNESKKDMWLPLLFQA